MEKDQIFPQMRFVNNENFHKKYISKFLTITRIIVEIIIYRLEISFLLEIKVHNIPQ